MIKADLVNCAGNMIGNRERAEAVVNAMLETICEAVCQGDTVKLPNFGIFKQMPRKARQGRNPRTGEMLEIAACNVVKFTPAASLKQEISDYTL